MKLIKEKGKKLMALLTVCALMVGVLPIGVYAADQTGITWGTDITESINGNTLTLSGTGTMTDFGWTDNDFLTSTYGITEVIIEDGITSIGNYAFRSNQLTSITIPNSVISIGDVSFDHNKLTSITIPNSVTNIGNSAFSNNELTSITIPNNVMTIGNGAFSDNVLTSITLPNSITSIGNYAFRSNQLTSITIPNSVISIGAASFDHNKLTSITIPNSVTNIGNSAFSNNELTSITIPNNVMTIGNGAFSDNVLTSITLPNSITSISHGLFSNNKLESIIIPNNIINIGIGAFFQNELTSISIPNSVTTIEDNAFNYNQLTSLTIPESVTTIKASAFRNNQLTSLTIPNSVTLIGDYVFANNILTSVEISNALTEIPYMAFGENRLTTIEIPNSVITIGDSAFRVNLLTSITIPNSVKVIGNNVFQNNYLTSITIPSNVEAIGDYVFQNNNLTSITMDRADTTIGNRLVYFMNDRFKIAYMEGGIGEYTGTQMGDWSKGFSNEYKAVTGITSVPITGTVGTGLTLSGTVAPLDATNKTIVWSVKSGTATMTGTNEVTATAEGDVVVTATIINGLTDSTNYTQDFTITFSNAYKAVTGIIGVPTTGTVGTGLTLSGTVAPLDATNKTIVWSVKSGTATITGSAVTATAVGEVVVTATITNGSTASTNYTQDFAITFSNEYKAVTGITGVPTTGTVGMGLTLSGTVAPADATNNAIVWRVKSGTATITGSAVTATAVGEVVVTATITNGSTASTNYTQDFAITFSNEYKAVTSISGTPTTGTAGTEVDLTGATVNPADATNKTIAWSVKNAGTTGVTTANLATGKFTPAAGTLVLTATITNGATASTNYTQDVTISVNLSETNIYTISADTAPFNFGSLTTGYGSAPASQMVTIINTGNQTITLTEPATTNSSSNYTIGLLSDTTLDANDTAVFTLQPKIGLVVGTYNETIRITGTDSAATSVSVQFSVTSSGGSSSGSGGGGSTATTVIKTNTGRVTGNQLNNAAGVAKDGETVTIKSNKTSEVTFSTSGLDSLTSNNNSLTVVTDNGTLTFNSKAVAAMGTQAAATDIKVIVEDVVKTTLTGDQQAKVGDKNVYDLTVISGGKLISSFNGGKVNVSIPYELKEGETADNLTVWYMADDGNLTEIKCTYDTKTKSVVFVVDHFSKYIIGYDDLADWVNPFTDVKSSAWYYNAVAFVNMNGLMKGRTDTTFGSEIAMTRGMFVTILGRMEGVDDTMYANRNTFSDVKSNQYYTPYIAWASDKGIVSGTGGDKFAPNAAVTREQMAVMITNYMKFKDQGPKGEWAIQLNYGDLDRVSSWADEGVMFMTMKDLMKGMGNDANGNPLFAPKSTSTRAQTAQVMMNLEELLK